MVSGGLSWEVRVGPPDSPADLVEDERLRRPDTSRLDLRLARLPDSHPASPRYVDARDNAGHRDAAPDVASEAKKIQKLVSRE